MGLGWGYLSSTFTLLLPLYISLLLCVCLSLTHMHKQPSKLWPISHHHCLAGWCFFVSLQLFSPSLMLRFPFPAARRPPLTRTSLTLTPTSYCAETGLFLELSRWFKDVKSILCHGFFREETGYFSFCPLTSISFPSLHPLFPSLKPSKTLPYQHTFFFSRTLASLSLSNHPIVNTTPPPCYHLPPHTYTILLFSRPLSRLRSLSS